MDVPVDLIFLDEAVLCEDCHMISRMSQGRGQTCPACRSGAIALLRPMLEQTLRKAVIKKVEAGL